jgi:hypothetical protein
MDSRVYSIVTLVRDPRLASGAMGFEEIQWVSSIQLTELPVHNLSGAQQPVIGNIPSGNYHSPHCSGYSQINLENRVEFASGEEAEAAAYVLAENCK